jgi:hypothetical protein
MDYEKDINIDEQALDIEWLNQSNLMGRYAKHAAITKKEMDEARERLDVQKALLEKDIRSNPECYGLNKVTEGAIQSTILLQTSYQELSQNYINAKYENEVAIAAVRAIDQKKTALENLVKLLGASYFAGPKAPRDLTGEWLKKQENKAINAKVQIRRRGVEE